ncbi:MAG: TPM domain-containing protein [Polyangiaceae bacterium]
MSSSTNVRAVLARFAWFAVVVSLFVAAFAPRAAFAFTPPTLEGPVTDKAKVLSVVEKERIADKVLALKAAHGHEVAVLVVPTLGGETVEDFAYETAKAWGLGSAERDDGVLFLVATAERKIRIETGKGVGGDLTDVDASRIIRDNVAPELKSGRYAAGIEAGVDAIGARFSGVAPPAEPGPSGGSSGMLSVLFVMVAMVVIFALQAKPRRRGGSRGGSDWSGGGSGGSDWSGGSSGGSDFGGGGGDFGGGGSSGDY